MSRLLKIGYTTIDEAVAKGIIDANSPKSADLYHNYGEFFDEVLYFVPFGKTTKSVRLNPTLEYQEAAFAPRHKTLIAAFRHLWRITSQLDQLVERFQPSVVQVCGPHIPALLSLLSSRVRRRPTVCFIEAYWETLIEHQRYFPAFARYLLPLWYRLVYKMFDIYTGTPSLNPDFYRTKGMASEKIARWVQEIDLRLIDAVQASDAPSQVNLLPRPLVCLVGRLHPEKLAGEALRIFSRAAQLGCPGSLVVVGDGSERPELEQYCSKQALTDRVIFLGQQPLHRVLAIMKACDAMIAPLQGTALVEALACGLAVVAYDHETHRAHITDGVNGRLTPHRQIDAAANALAGLLFDSESRHRLGEAARDYVAKQYSFEKMYSIVNDGFIRALAIAK